MNEKMDLFRCDGCDHSGHEYGCYSWIANGDTPENCVTNVNGNDNVNWQKTTGYEITKITDEVTQYVLDGIEKDFQKPHLEEINIPAPPDPPPKRKICEDIRIERSVPNCSICQWKDQEKYKTEYSCGGQGMRKLTSVYGNKICKRLFKEKPGTEPDQE